MFETIVTVSLFDLACFVVYPHQLFKVQYSQRLIQQESQLNRKILYEDYKRAVNAYRNAESHEVLWDKNEFEAVSVLTQEKRIYNICDLFCSVPPGPEEFKIKHKITQLYDLLLIAHTNKYQGY